MLNESVIERLRATWFGAALPASPRAPFAELGWLAATLRRPDQPFDLHGIETEPS